VDGLNLRQMTQTCVPVKGQILKREQKMVQQGMERIRKMSMVQGSNGPITCKILGMGSYKAMVDEDRM
jgi:hypothetical protein